MSYRFEVIEKEKLLKKLEKEGKFKEVAAGLLENIKEVTGKDYVLYEKKNTQNGKVAFSQNITHNLQLLNRIGYFTIAEQQFLFVVVNYLDFSTNVIVKEQFKNLNKNKRTRPENFEGDFTPPELAEAAGPTYLCQLTGTTREHTSKVMNSLKKKGVLATGSTGIVTDDGRVCSSRTWFVNPHLFYCGDKSDINPILLILFRDTLTNLKDKNGKKVKLPVRLFL